MSNPQATSFYNGVARRAAGVAQALRRQARHLLPQHCELCAAAAPDALLCAACAAALPTIGEACPRCALPSTAAAICGSCLVHPPPFDAALAAHVYAFPVDRLLQGLKYGGRLALADWAAAALESRVRATATAPMWGIGPPLLVPLPLSPERQRQRGFNQAQEIARDLARRLALPVDAVLQRPRGAPPQAGLPWSERVRNVRGAFTARRRLDGARIILIDDVMTTGATLAEAASTARRAGALRVECWVVARTLPPAQS